jgi:hypothetical protein
MEGERESFCSGSGRSECWGAQRETLGFSERDIYIFLGPNSYYGRHCRPGRAALPPYPQQQDF